MAKSIQNLNTADFVESDDLIINKVENRLVFETPEDETVYLRRLIGKLVFTMVANGLEVGDRELLNEMENI